jgi:TonB-dependent receptor
MKRVTNLFALLCFLPLSLLAQKGSISGKIIDAKLAEALIGASVRLEDGSGGGAVTDLDGNFMIANVPAGTHKITINYTGYQVKTIEDVLVKNGEASTVDISMEESADLTTIAEVVVTAKASRESMSALTILQKTSPTIADGISAETIKRTPDRTTGDVIRRVSGASIQDNKFAVIRGLNDRYNIAMLNGALLSSTEPDRKAFSFDLFPSAMLDNLVVMKTASADLPGEFAGGAILINTRDIPEENYLSVNVSGGYNNVTTFEPYLKGVGGSTDWLGLDDGTRALPDGYPSANDFITAPKDDKIRYSKLFDNDWAITENSSAAPNVGFQISSGLLTDPSKKTQLGTTIGFAYSNQNRLQNGIRADYDSQQQLFEFNDKQFKNNVLWGGLINSALKFNNRQKLILQATYSTNTDNIISDRVGKDFEQTRDIQATAIEYTENHLLTTRLGGEHTLTENDIRFSWGGGYNRSTRDVPSLRRMFYSRIFDAAETEPFVAFVPLQADPFRSGRFYSDLWENVVNGNVDLSIPLSIAGTKQSMKVGGLYQGKEREFGARVMGWTRPATGFDFDLLYLPQDRIFADSNIRTTGFVMGEITNQSDRYDAGSDLSAAYVLFDNKIFEKLRISWGVRMENFNQRLNSIDYTQDSINIDQTTTSWLPSANLTYALNEQHQLRFSASKTVTRPEFRELAPFTFYDFYLNAGVRGNPTLTSGEILNFDLRYEWYPGQNQLFSASLFYKKFDNPIEFTFSSQGAGTRTFTYQNIPSATNYGVEFELRKNFDFIGEHWENLVVFTNVALIRSELDLSNVEAYDTTRALQGQSPYIVNIGLSYNMPKIGLNTTLSYNTIGDRVAQVGNTEYGDIYERRRDLLDFQVSKKIGQRGEVKFTCSDILRPDFIFYQDNNKNHEYDEDADNVMQKLNYGSTFTLSLGYRF